MKKISVILVSLMLLLAISLNSFAVSGITFKATIPKNKVGSTIKIPITVAGVNKVNGINNFDFTLTYDAKLLQVTTVSPGKLVKNAADFTYTLKDGLVKVYFCDESQGSRTILKDGDVVYITCKVKKVNPKFSKFTLGGLADKNMATLKAQFTSINAK